MAPVSSASPSTGQSSRRRPQSRRTSTATAMKTMLVTAFSGSAQKVAPVRSQ